MKIKTMPAAATVCTAFMLMPTAAGAAPVTGGAGAAYGEHVSTHASVEGGFSGQMNPGDHRGFSGFDEHYYFTRRSARFMQRVPSTERT